MGLEEFDDDFKPENPFSGGKAEDLSDGDYEFLISDARMKEAKGKNLVELKLKVLTPGKHEGAEISEAIWMSNREAAKRCGWILKQFGFDTDDWTKENNRPMSRELPKAMRWLRGMKVKAKKVTTKQPPKFPKDVEHVYHNINFKGRSESDDGIPRKIGQVELDSPDPNAEAEADPFAESA